MREPTEVNAFGMRGAKATTQLVEQAAKESAVGAVRLTHAGQPHRLLKGQLYTEAQRERRNRSKWTLVQGILAPVQFLIFLASLVLVARYLLTGEGIWLADASIVVKTAALYTIMVTGAIWEKDVFGQYLFAPAFFWEDVFSMLVLALHTAYLVMLFAGFGTAEQRMHIALAAYLAYVINAGQFLWKLREARLQAATIREPSGMAAQG